MALRDLYPSIRPFRHLYLQVSDLHRIYVEECGNPQGRPVVFLHGGPGGGCDPVYRRFFDPEKWRIILFDQRGAGRSEPFAELRENTTWDLVADIEAIRTELGLETWAIFGGSWGSTLALAYAQTHPERCTHLFLRGIFMIRKQEIDWFYQHGASLIFPDAWAPYRDHIPEDERHDFLAAYHRRLTSDDRATRLEAARIWSIWEGSCSRLRYDPELVQKYGSEGFAEAFARIENHYFIHGGFFERDDQLLANAHRLRGIPGVIVHGRYDIVCPLGNAWDLHAVWPEAELHVIPDAGHSVTEPGIRSKLIEYTDRWA